MTFKRIYLSQTGISPYYCMAGFYCRKRIEISLASTYNTQEMSLIKSCYQIFGVNLCRSDIIVYVFGVVAEIVYLLNSLINKYNSD